MKIFNKKNRVSWLVIALIPVMVGMGCSKTKIEPFLDGFYGTEEHIYIIDNAYDDATSVKIVAVWDNEGKVKLSSELIPKTTESENQVVIIDVPGDAVDFQDSKLALRDSELNFEISYDANGLLSWVSRPKSIPFFCCVSICTNPNLNQGTCHYSYSSSGGWICGGSGCCGQRNCRENIERTAMPKHSIYIQATEID